MHLTLDPPWLVADLGAPHRILGWPLNRPGYGHADRIAWRELRNSDLPEDEDPAAWLAAELAGRGLGDIPTMLTSRGLDHHILRRAEIAGQSVDALATVGLSNGERVGARRKPGGGLWGTINLALRLSAPLTDGALLEALSIAVEARTAAVLDASPDRPGGRITGTGTDCVIVAAPPGPIAYAGLHTPLGEAIGKATYDAVRQGADAWWSTFARADGWRPSH